MTVWEYQVNEGYADLFLVKDGKRNSFENGAVFEDIQPDPETRIVTTLPESEPRLPFADFVNYWGAVGGSACIVSEKAKSVLEKNFADVTQQFIPCVCEDFPQEKLWIWNACNYRDVADISRSEYDTVINLKGERVICSIKRYAFYPEAAEPDIFKVIVEGRKRTAELFVSDRFLEVIRASGLTGFACKKVCEL